MSCVLDEPGVSSEPRFEFVGDSPSQRAFEALALLDGAVIELMDRDDLDSVMQARRALAAFAVSVDIRVARRSRQLAAEGRSESASGVLRDCGRRSGRDAAAAAGREQACEQLPSFETALAAGTVSAGHLDAVANATAKLDEAAKAEFTAHESELLDAAAESSVESFERQCRDIARSIIDHGAGTELERQRAANNIRQWNDKVTGMHHLHAELDPETGAKIWTAINDRLRTLRHQQPRPTSEASDDPTDTTMTYTQLEAQAFAELVTGSTMHDRRTPEVVVLVDWATLVAGLSALPDTQSVCETSNGMPLPPATIRRLCCEARILPAVMNGDSEALDVGRAQRLATPAQRRAIIAMYRTCGFPDCQTPVDRCEIHHVLDWLGHGPTDLDNMLPLCSHHHHLVHEGGWRLTLGTHRQVTIHRPDGNRYSASTTTNRRPTPT